MSKKKSTRNIITEPDYVDESSLKPVTVRQQSQIKPMDLVELKPGLFLNKDQVVSVRVLPKEAGEVYAILQLSNGDKLNLSRGEFTMITDVEPIQPARPLWNPNVP